MKRKLLRIVLAVTGALFCIAAPALLVPQSGLRAMGAWFVGWEQVEALWPAGPFFDYFLRMSLVAYLWIGVILVVAAVNPERHRTQIDIATGGLFLFALVAFVVGFGQGLPVGWFLGDAISTLAAAALLLALRLPKPQG